MQVSIRRLSRIDVLDLAGGASVDGPLRLRHAFHEVVERGGRRFLLNLRDLGVVDSLTVGEMVACLKRAREQGGEVKLVVATHGIVHDLLQLTGLERVFEIYGDEGEAAASFEEK